MATLSHIVTAAQSGCTVRDLLSQQWRISSSLRKLLHRRENAILCNGLSVRMGTVLAAGDLVQVDVSDAADQLSAVQPVDFPLSILWEDEHLLAVDKPAGITVHGAALTEETVTVVGAAAHYLGSTAVHVVNRLDRGTSGVMLLAKNGYMHSRCMELLHSDAFHREYRAVCDGVPVPSRGIIDAPIARDTASLLRRCVDPAGQRAVTEYAVLSVHNGRALVQLLPQTGRTHQLRVHFASIGAPIAGDTLYGRESDADQPPRQCLHAAVLTFCHPMTGERLTVSAPLPEDILPFVPSDARASI